MDNKTKPIDACKRYFFRDKVAENSTDYGGLSYAASGIIAEVFDEHGACMSGKHVAVEYIDPLGRAQMEWRDLDAIIIDEADGYDYVAVRSRIEQAGLANG